MLIAKRHLLHGRIPVVKGAELVPDRVVARNGDKRPRLSRMQVKNLLAAGWIAEVPDAVPARK